MEAGIIAMREAGKTRKEIAEYYGLEKKQKKNWVNAVLLGMMNKKICGTRGKCFLFPLKFPPGEEIS